VPELIHHLPRVNAERDEETRERVPQLVRREALRQRNLACLPQPLVRRSTAGARTRGRRQGGDDARAGRRRIDPSEEGRAAVAQWMGTTSRSIATTRSSEASAASDSRERSAGAGGVRRIGRAQQCASRTQVDIRRKPR